MTTPEFRIIAEVFLYSVGFIKVLIYFVENIFPIVTLFVGQKFVSEDSTDLQAVCGAVVISESL